MDQTNRIKLYDMNEPNQKLFEDVLRAVYFNEKAAIEIDRLISDKANVVKLSEDILIGQIQLMQRTDIIHAGAVINAVSDGRRTYFVFLPGRRFKTFVKNMSISHHSDYMNNILSLYDFEREWQAFQEKTAQRTAEEERGGRFRQARIDAKLTPDDVAEETGVSGKTVISWEAGATYPKPDVMDMVAKMYMTDKYYLLYGD